MSKWMMSTVSEMIATHDPTWASGVMASALPSSPLTPVHPAQHQWQAAIAALHQLLDDILLDPPFAVRSPKGPKESDLTDSSSPACKGVILSGPTPVLSIPEMASWTFNVRSIQSWLPFQLCPAQGTTLLSSDIEAMAVPLLPGDPLASEPFCLIATATFSFVMVLGEHPTTHEPSFMFSFLPEVVERVWEGLRPRVLLGSAGTIARMDELAHQFAPVPPEYGRVMAFSRWLLHYLSEESLARAQARSHIEEFQGSGQTANGFTPTDYPTVTGAVDSLSEESLGDVELLQAIAHEIRTPLTTIRTLTRLLLKRTELPDDVIRRLESIERECREQIDRFGLIFRAVELETSDLASGAMALTRMPLEQVFAECVPRWKRQASQRNLELEVGLPAHMPTVVSDPTMLDQALTSLIERFTRSLPSGSQIRLDVTPAGNQLKVQLHASSPDETDSSFHQPLMKALGQVLVFQPETGSVSLNMAVTKNLFQAIGGKLIVKQRSEQADVMTVYLPLER